MRMYRMEIIQKRLVEDYLDYCVYFELKSIRTDESINLFKIQFYFSVLNLKQVSSGTLRFL